MIKPKYGIGDKLLVKGSYLDQERILTVSGVQVRKRERWDRCISLEEEVYYEFKESLWMHNENEILRKVKL